MDGGGQGKKSPRSLTYFFFPPPPPPPPAFLAQYNTSWSIDSGRSRLFDLTTTKWKRKKGKYLYLSPAIYSTLNRIYQIIVREIIVSPFFFLILIRLINSSRLDVMVDEHRL